MVAGGCWVVIGAGELVVTAMVAAETFVGDAVGCLVGVCVGIAVGDDVGDEVGVVHPCHVLVGR